MKNVLQIQATRSFFDSGGFAVILSNGSVVTWVMLSMVATVVLCRIS